MVPPRRFSTLSAIAALTALYFVAGKLGLHLAFLHQCASPFWPPAGFASWSNYWPVWLTWWLGDAAGDLIVAPLILLWSIPSSRRWTRRQAIEVGILLLLLVCLAEIVFGGWSSISARNYPLSFICGPIVIWTAFRFSQRETAT